MRTLLPREVAAVSGGSTASLPVSLLNVRGATPAEVRRFAGFSLGSGGYFTTTETQTEGASSIVVTFHPGSDVFNGEGMMAIPRNTNVVATDIGVLGGVISMTPFKPIGDWLIASAAGIYFMGRILGGPNGLTYFEYIPIGPGAAAGVF